METARENPLHQEREKPMILLVPIRRSSTITAALSVGGIREGHLEPAVGPSTAHSDAWTKWNAFARRQDILTTPKLSGYLDEVRRRQPGPAAPGGPERRAIKAALVHLAKGNGRAEVLAYPGCIAPLVRLRETVDHEIVVRVRASIEAGATWAQVAEQLGVSRQAAHERYAPQILSLAQAAFEDHR
jgi:hypothetical protein